MEFCGHSLRLKLYNFDKMVLLLKVPPHEVFSFFFAKIAGFSENKKLPFQNFDVIRTLDCHWFYSFFHLFLRPLNFGNFLARIVIVVTWLSKNYCCF